MGSIGTGTSMDEQKSNIVSCFKQGREYVFEWTDKECVRIMDAMKALDDYLGNFDPALSYAGTDEKIVWRKSCWMASLGIRKSLLDTEREIAKFDGDLKDGLTGLQALQYPRVKDAMLHLKHALDESLVTTAHALNVPAAMLDRCTTRYRIIKYTAHAGNPGGIGLHPDGNLLSALITNGAGLGVYDYDGTLRHPGFEGTILMGGSTLYRWSNGTYLPTFHDVGIGADQEKASIVAFLNFPDMENIPRTLDYKGKNVDFFHDIRWIKDDDRLPTGELAPLWRVIVDKHQLRLPSSSPQP